MPDKHGFNHLGPHHICIEEGCGWPGHFITVPEADRERHARKHERERVAEIERKRLANLRDGRRRQRQAKRENEQAYRD